MRTTRIFRYLALTLVLACLSAGAVNAQSGTCGANLTWTLSNGTLTISGTGDMYNYSYGNIPWWDYRNSITNTIIGNDVTSIGEYAFYYCEYLTSVSIGNSVISIGYRTFMGCSNLSSITIPNSVTGIGKEAFYGCGLTSVTFGSYVASIGESAFKACNYLTSVTIPNSVTSIGKEAFYSCSRLTLITLGNSVASIGEDAFFSSNLTAINVDGNNLYLSSEDGVLFNKNRTTIICYPRGKTDSHYTIPNGIANIGDKAFYYCNRLTSITIPHGVTSIGNEAFAVCEPLTSITIPSSVTTIGNEAFAHCRGLAQIHNQRAAPQTINANVFTDVKKQTCKLYAPVGSLSAYRNAAVWKDFTNIVEENSTGIETVSAHSPALYPNPVVNGQLTIENGQLNDVVQIYDISGRMVETVRAPSLRNGTQTINVSALPAGVYFVKTNNGQTLKFIKK